MREIIVDNFAGGGGASTGIEMATGRSVDIAINHDPAAIAMHEANHPETEHYCESVWDVDPRAVAAGRQVGLCWLSPDCKHFSKAKGGKPVEKKIRGLAWVALRWAATVRPRVIMLENVTEFQTWGPVIPKRDPETGRMLKKIRSESDEEDDTIVVSEPGERVPLDQRVMIPDPKRKGITFRSFVNALRRQGYEVDYRELKACDYGAPTIRKRFFLVARRDGRPIKWPKPTHGDPESAAVKAGRLPPWRTAAGIIDWSIPCPSIFERARPLADNTMRRIARGIQRFVVDNPNPFIVRIGQTGFGGDRLQYEVDAPLTTITTKAEHLLVAPFLTQYHSYDDSARGQTLDRPLLTQDTSNRYGLVAAFIAKHYGGMTGVGADTPLPTTTMRGTQNQIVTSHLIKLRGTCADGQPVTDPAPTITAGGLHVGEVRSFLIKYYGAGVGQELTEPLHTIPTHDRFGLVTIEGVDYQIIDIGMRMLEPHELFAAQGFPANYIIDQDANGQRYPKSAQVARCGNSVPPPFAEALVRANLPEICTGAGHRLTFERYRETEGQLQLSI